MKKTIALLSWVTFSFVSLGAQAAGSNGFVTSADGRQTIALHPPAQNVARPAAKAHPGLAVIFSNLNSDPSNVYGCCSGWTISGPDSVVGSTYADAMPFTPSVNAMVKKITVAVGYVTGTNGVTVSLNADAGGLPGAVIKSFNVSGLPGFGGCCMTETVSPKGVNVTAGTQYWVVVKTSKKTADTWDAWNINSTDSTNYTFAFYNNGVWSQVSGPLGAFEVLGK